MVALDRYVPLQTQVTIELTGRMLPGSEIGAALTVLDSMQVDVVGLNCATGPVEMSEGLRHLWGPAASPSPASPMRASRRWSTASCTTTSPPRTWPSTCTAS